MWNKKVFQLEEVVKQTGIEQTIILSWIEKEWIVPIHPGASSLDEEDIARASLIKELLDDLGANEESISIILHLLDQIHQLHHTIKLKRIEK